MVSAAQVGQSYSLPYASFASLVRIYDWDSVVGESNGDLNPAKGIYERDFGEGALGFRVRHDASCGTIFVSRVVLSGLGGVDGDLVGVGDAVVAINGAPLGFVTNAKVLQEKIRPLVRPVRITFLRTPATEASVSGKESQLQKEPGSVPFPAAAPSSISIAAASTPPLRESVNVPTEQSSGSLAFSDGSTFKQQTLRSLGNIGVPQSTGPSPSANVSIFNSGSSGAIDAGKARVKVRRQKPD